MYGKGRVELLAERTNKEFNVVCSQLHSGSHQKVYVRCSRCGEEFCREYRNLHQLHGCPSHIVRDDGLRLKWCNGCQQFISYSLFSKNAARYDGLCPHCDKCRSRPPSHQRHAKKRAEKRRTPRGWCEWMATSKKSRCAKHGIEYELDGDFIWDMCQAQDGKCYYSGIVMEFGTGTLRSAQIDRLNPERGYLRDNVVLACKAMNLGKHSAMPSAFREFLAELLQNLRSSLRIEVKSIGGKFPVRRFATDAGYDVSAADDAVVPARGIASVPTGLAVRPPSGAYLTVEGRSSLGLRGVMPFRGIIDGCYEGNLMIVLYNHSDIPYSITSGDRIAQLVAHEVLDVDHQVVAQFATEPGSRGEAGFGSSGL